LFLFDPFRVNGYWLFLFHRVSLRFTRGYSGSSPSGLWFLPQKDLERWLFLFHRVSLSLHPGLFRFKPFRALVPAKKRFGTLAFSLPPGFAFAPPGAIRVQALPGFGSCRKEIWNVGFFSSTGFRFRATRGYSGSSPSGLWFLPKKDLER
jgi:hypothetical protein